jgi:hypothetical protein
MLNIRSIKTCEIGQRALTLLHPGPDRLPELEYGFRDSNNVASSTRHGVLRLSRGNPLLLLDMVASWEGMRISWSVGCNLDCVQDQGGCCNSCVANTLTVRDASILRYPTKLLRLELEGEKKDLISVRLWSLVDQARDKSSSLKAVKIVREEICVSGVLIFACARST